jgi:hypothetical protein
MILRHPVDRTISAFNMFWQLNRKGIFAMHNATSETEKQALWGKLLHEEIVR